MKSLARFFCALTLALVVFPVGCSSSGNGPADDTYLPEFPALPDEATETAAIQAVTSGLKQALEAGDADAAGAFFTPSVREEQVAWFKAHPDLLGDLAGALSQPSLSTLSDEYGWQEKYRARTASVAINADGKTFYIELAKVDGQWLIQVF